MVVKSSGKYHISKNGEVALCKAGVRTCPLGGEHYNTVQEALRGLENQFSGAFGNAPLTKNTIKNTPIKTNVNNQKTKIQKLFADGNTIKERGVIDKNGNVIKSNLTYKEFYDGLNKKFFKQPHEDEETFSKKNGSQFDAEYKDLHDVLYQTETIREKGLEGDDRQLLINAGVSSENLSDKYRYIMSPCGGTVDTIHSSDIPENTMLDFYENPPNSNKIALTVKMKKPHIAYSTLVFDKANNVLVDAYPGINNTIIDHEKNKLDPASQQALEQTEKRLITEMKERNLLTVKNLRTIKGKIRGKQQESFNVKIIN